MEKTTNRLLWAALALVALSGVTALAAPVSNPPSGILPQDIPFSTPAPGETLVGVQVTRQDPQKLTFEVPLYMTVAVVNGAGDTDATVVCPTAYAIKSTTVSADGTEADIAVTGMAVKGAAGGSWSLAQGTPTGPNSIGLSIGGVRLPDVAKGDGEVKPVDLKAAGSLFYTTGTQKYTPIPNDNIGLTLPIQGFLPAGTKVTADKAPTPQFRCIYTVSLLDKIGAPIGVLYDGPSLADTGS